MSFSSHRTAGLFGLVSSFTAINLLFSSFTDAITLNYKHSTIINGNMSERKMERHTKCWEREEEKGKGKKWSFYHTTSLTIKMWLAQMNSRRTSTRSFPVCAQNENLLICIFPTSILFYFILSCVCVCNVHCALMVLHSIVPRTTQSNTLKSNLSSTTSWDNWTHVRSFPVFKALPTSRLMK